MDWSKTYIVIVPIIKLAVVIIANELFFSHEIKFHNLVIIYSVFVIEQRVMGNDFYVTQFIDKDEL